MRRFKPVTRYGWLTLIFYIISLLFVVFQGGKTSLMLFVMFNGLGVYLLMGKWSGIGSIHGVRTVNGLSGEQEILTGGSRIRVSLQMQVPGIWPLPYVIVREKLIRITGGDCQEYELSFVPDYRRRGSVTYETAPLRRGRYLFEQTLCSTRDIFGLFEHRGAFKQTHSVSIMPRTIDLTEWRQFRRSKSGVFQQRAASIWSRETTQIDGVREYIHGDRMSRIHWNATARTGQWKSKEYEREALPRFVVVLDRLVSSYRSAEGFELAVSAAASLLNLAFRRGIPIGFVSAGAQVHTFGSGRTPVTREEIMNHLIDTEADGRMPLGEALVEASGRFEIGSNFVLISPSSDEATGKALKALASRRIEPSQVYIAERSGELAESQQFARWRSWFVANQWNLCTINRLEDLPQALEAGTA